jgi:hypothetical protein
MRFSLAGLVVFLVAAPVAAQMSIAMNALDLVDAKIDYAADYQLVSGRQVYDGHVIHAPHRERWEFLNGGAQQVLLLRRDIDEAAMLWPEKRWFMSASFSFMASMLGGLGNEVLHGREAGVEKVGTETAIRYRVDKGAFIGDLWRSQDGILLRAKGKVTFNGQPTEGELVLYNLSRAKVDPTVFAKPQGWLGLPLNFGKKN